MSGTKKNIRYCKRAVGLHKAVPVRLTHLCIPSTHNEISFSKGKLNLVLKAEVCQCNYSFHVNILKLLSRYSCSQVANRFPGARRWGRGAGQAEIYMGWKEETTRAYMAHGHSRLHAEASKAGESRIIS